MPTPPTTPKNINVTAFRVLTVLRYLLHFGPLTSQALNALLLQTPGIQRGFGSETLTKYMNTLRYLGSDIPRATNANQFRYEVTHLPLSVHLTHNEGDLLAKVITTTLANPACCAAWITTWQQVLWSVHCPDSQSLADINYLLGSLNHPALKPKSDGAHQPVPPLTQPSPIQEKTTPLLTQWQQYCDDNQALTLTYCPTTGHEETLCLDPEKLITRQWGTLLVGTNRQTGKTRLLHLGNITHVQQLPLRRQGRHQPKRVRFKLFGKLATSYRLYPGEAMVPSTAYPFTTEQQPSIEVLSTISEIPVVLHRLLKYGPYCQVLSPESAVTAMRTHINHLQHGVTLSASAAR